MNWKSRRNYKKCCKAPRIYAVVLYAKWCVCEYRFAGKYEWDDILKDYVPLVYHYDDHNGVYETYDVRKLTHTTSGFVFGWTFSPIRANSWVAQQRLLGELNYGKTDN